MRNMKTILAVWHVANKGKTDSLRAAARYLLVAYPGHIGVHPTPFLIPASGDFRFVVNINGKIVAIETRGDPHTELLERLETLEKTYNPDVILCSTRTKGDTVDAVNSMVSKYKYEAVWASTYQVESRFHSTANALNGQHLINLLQRLGII